jgi:hypothetical protein
MPMVEFRGMSGERVFVNPRNVMWMYQDPQKIGSTSLVLQIIPVAGPGGRLTTTLFTLDVQTSIDKAAMLLDGENIIDLSHPN